MKPLFNDLMTRSFAKPTHEFVQRICGTVLQKASKRTWTKKPVPVPLCALQIIMNWAISRPGCHSERLVAEKVHAGYVTVSTSSR